MRLSVTRLADAPIIGPALHPSIGTNIQGPSLIRAPLWMRGRLGAYHLYFADHKGRFIRLAYADRLRGPWRIHPPGSLDLTQSCFLTAPPPVSPAEYAMFQAQGSTGGVARSHDLLAEITTPHIASPDVHLDARNRRILMYFHGLDGVACQVSRVALSADGITFAAQPEVIGPSYMRVFHHAGLVYALTMPGMLSRSADGLRRFETGPTLFNPDMRHAAVLKRDDVLWVFWTQVGHAPERILMSRIDLRGDWHTWRDEPPVEVLRPERPWEGAGSPLTPSVRGTAHGLLNQLRDPAVFEEDGILYLLYVVGGESGIALARIDVLPTDVKTSRRPLRRGLYKARSAAQ